MAVQGHNNGAEQPRRNADDSCCWKKGPRRSASGSLSALPLQFAKLPSSGSSGKAPLEPASDWGCRTWSLRSERTAVHQTLMGIRGWLSALPYHERDAFAVLLTLDEALHNALEHGNRFDIQKSIHVAICMHPDQAWMAVEDEGPGFCPDGVPDPTLPENIGRSRGRGIFFMRKYMHEIDYNPCGNRVTMRRFVNDHDTSQR